MKALLALSRAIDAMNERLGRLANWLVLIACLISAGNAMMRYAFDMSSNAWLEVQWYLFAGIVMFGASYTLRLNEHSLVQLGWGVHQQRIQATITSNTRHIAVEVAQDKELTASLLERAGLPVPRHDRARSADEAVTIAERIGYPVVVKPMDLSHGRGVALDLRTAAQVRDAFDKAYAMSSMVLVANLIGILSGEWKGAPRRSMRLLFTGLGLLVLSIGLLGAANAL